MSVFVEDEDGSNVIGSLKVPEQQPVQKDQPAKSVPGEGFTIEEKSAQEPKIEDYDKKVPFVLVPPQSMKRCDLWKDL